MCAAWSISQARKWRAVAPPWGMLVNSEEFPAVQAVACSLMPHAAHCYALKACSPRPLTFVQQ